MSSKDFTRDIAKYPCVSGGYLRVAITADGGLLCPHCVRANYKECALADQYDDTQWQIVAIAGEYDCRLDFGCEDDPDALICNHCYRPLNSI